MRKPPKVDLAVFPKAQREIYARHILASAGPVLKETLDREDAVVGAEDLYVLASLFRIVFLAGHSQRPRKLENKCSCDLWGLTSKGTGWTRGSMESTRNLVGRPFPVIVRMS